VFVILISAKPLLISHNVGLLLAKLSAYANPRQGIYGRDAACDVEVRRGWGIYGLALTRKQEVGVLEREGEDAHIIAS
jgi:hypothetical protein